ncbi:MAG: dihydrolipoyl dehydrogenase [Prevotella sp.]|nr:dihydrolipoyl dehydrogenase [Prevotella sp.]
MNSNSKQSPLPRGGVGGGLDLIIIGAGPGGYRAAELAAKAGLKVVIFEAAEVGGTCLNEGCIPTKTYARNAEAVALMREAATFGIHYDGDFSFSLAEARQRKDEVIATLRSGIGTLLSHPNITLVKAEARFVDAHTVTADAETYTAPNIIVATGSVPKTLRLNAPAACLDSRDLLQLDRLPKSLCIVGAGVIGMEFASIFSTFGTEVTVVEFLKECLPALDSDIAKRLRKVLEKRGVTFNLQSAVKEIRQEDNTKVVVFEDKKGREQTVEAEQVLMAVGRAPRVFDHFRNAGFDYDERRGITVDDHMQTTVPGIYAIGDVNGRQMLAHAAECQAKVAVESLTLSDFSSDTGVKSLNTQRSTLNAQTVPAAIFTSPEAACVGLTEDQLKEQGAAYECRKAFHRANGKALAMNEPEGMLKLLSEPDAGRILGCHAYGAHAADLIQEASSLMCRQTTVGQLREMVHIHPTLSEILLAAAEQ